MLIRFANVFLFTSLLWSFSCALCLAQDPQVFKGIDSGAIGFSPDGKWLAAAGKKPPKAGDSGFVPTSGLVKVWEISTSRELFNDVEEKWEATSLAFSPTAPLLAVGFNDYPRAEVVIDKEGIMLIYDEKMPPVPVKVWNLKTGKEHCSLLHDEDRSNLDNIRNVSFSHDGNTLATANSKLHFWDVTSKKKKNAISEPNWRQHAGVFSPAGKIIAVRKSKGAFTPDGKFNSENAIDLWDLEANKPTASFPASDLSRVLMFSPDGMFMAFEGVDNRIVRIYDLRRKAVISTFQTHGTHFQCVAFSPDSKILFTGGADGKDGQLEDCWKAWSVVDGRLLHTQKCPPASTNVLAVSPDGQRLATGGLDGSVRLWTLPKELGRKARK